MHLVMQHCRIQMVAVINERKSSLGGQAKCTDSPREVGVGSASLALSTRRGKQLAAGMWPVSNLGLIVKQLERFSQAGILPDQYPSRPDHREWPRGDSSVWTAPYLACVGAHKGQSGCLAGNCGIAACRYTECLTLDGMHLFASWDNGPRGQLRHPAPRQSVPQPSSVVWALSTARPQAQTWPLCRDP